MSNFTCRECGICFNPETESMLCPACGSENLFINAENPAPGFSMESSNKPESTSNKPTIFFGNTDYSCNDCGKTFKSHDKELFCPYCESSYILKHTEIEEDASKTIEDLIKEEKGDVYFFTFLILFVSVPLLLVSIINKIPPLFFGSLLCSLIALLISRPSHIPDKSRDKLDEDKPLPSLYVLIYSLFGNLFDALKSLPSHKIELLVIRNNAVIWSSPIKKRSNIVTIVNQGFRTGAFDIISRGETLWHSIQYKGHIRYILSDDSINLKGLFNKDLGHSLYIVGENSEVHIFESPTPESHIVQTLSRGFYIYNIGISPIYNTESNLGQYDFRHDSSIYWSVYYNETWIEINKGFGLIGYARRNDFYNYSTWI